MTKRADIYLRHMLDAIEKIEKYIKGYTRPKFEKDEKTIDAVIRQLEILGEAARNVSPELVGDSPVVWRKMVGMRNLLIHQYFGVDLNAVWETANIGLGDLKKYLKRKLEK